MRTLTCIIVDDEPLAVRQLVAYTERTPGLQLLNSFTDSIAAINAVKEQKPDLLFLDIQMPNINGMELARLIPEKTRVIFTTAFKEYAFESYEVSALDFLLKPIRYNKFIAAVEKAQRWFSRETETAATTAPVGRDNIFIRVDGELRLLNMSDIMYVSGMKDYVVFYLDDGSKLITHITMKAVEDMLPASDFLRIHRSYIVALKKIRSVDRNNCVYIGKEIIHVTDSYRPPFDAYLQKNML